MARIISPSVLAADFGNLARDIDILNRSRAEWIHIDVMDGVFVPNISFGFPVLKAVTKAAAPGKIIDTHLMITAPERYIERFAQAGSHYITIHAEATSDLRAAIKLIHTAGARAGVSVKPATPVESIFDHLDELDMVLVMSVEPGFGGQSFMPHSLDKVRALRAEIECRGLKTLIEIDGGISAANSRDAFDVGCDVLVAGNAIFGAPSPEAEIEKMLNV